MPLHNDLASSQLQVFISDYMIDSAMNAYLDVTNATFGIGGSKASQFMPFNFTTSSLTYVFPGLKSSYGSGIPINVEFNVNKADSFKIS